MFSVCGSLACALLVQVGPSSDFVVVREAFPQMRVSASPEKLDPPFVTPRGKYSLSQKVVAQVRLTASAPWKDRFLVFFDGEADAALAQSTARFLLQCWDANAVHLSLDHNPIFRGGAYDIYLCRGGKPGGEQRADEVRVNSKSIRVNTIYLYAVDQLSAPVETLRELAHEYGHATLPAMGGFLEPEDWGNGYLGEKLILHWLTLGKSPDSWHPDNFMGVSRESALAWLQMKAVPLRNMIFAAGPAAAKGRTQGQTAMDAYIGLNLFIDEVFPPDVAHNSLLFLAGESKEMWTLFEASLLGESEIKLSLDAFKPQKEGWIPLPNKYKVRGATVLSRQKGWAKVRLANYQPVIYR